jgi:hypothetical protein
MASTLELLNAAQMSLVLNRPTATLTMASSWSLGSQSITTPTLTAPWGSSNTDNWSGHSNTTNNTRYTVPLAGVYELSAVLQMSGNSTGQRFGCFFRNGTAIAATVVEVGASGTNPSLIVVPPWQQACAVGDYLEVGGSQNSGSTLTVGTAGTYFSIEFLHF